MTLAMMPAAAVDSAAAQSPAAAQEERDDAAVDDVVVITASRQEELLLNAQAPSDRFSYKISAGVLTQEPFPRPTVPASRTIGIWSA
jgi:hypothetical protein